MTYKNDTGYPSSTEILSPWFDKEWFTEEHSERGQIVHAALSTHLLGVWSAPIKTDYQGYVDSGKRWIDLMVEKVILVEERMIDKELGYCGQPDLIAILRGDTDICLCDWKTSVAKHISWRPQIASYRNLAVEDKEIITNRGISIRLNKDGKKPLVDEYRGFQNDFNIFKSALTTYKFFKGGNNGL